MNHLIEKVKGQVHPKRKNIVQNIKEKIEVAVLQGVNIGHGVVEVNLLKNVKVERERKVGPLVTLVNQNDTLAALVDLQEDTENTLIAAVHRRAVESTEEEREVRVIRQEGNIEVAVLLLIGIGRVREDANEDLAPDQGGSLFLFFKLFIVGLVIQGLSSGNIFPFFSFSHFSIPISIFFPLSFNLSIFAAEPN